MSFLKKLFGIADAPSARAGEPAAEETYEGCRIVAAPLPEGGRFRLAGTIEKEIGGEVRAHRLIRADVFASREEAADAAIRKARHLIDEQGESIFG